MGNYNDYSELWNYTGGLEKEKLVLSTTKSSLEAEIASLNGIIF